MGIMDLFIKVEDKDSKEKEPSQQKAPSSPVSIPVSLTLSIGQEDAEIKKQLATALEKANQPGYDYFEFAQSVDALSPTLPSEELRFKTAFTVIASTGVSAEKLLSSAQFYLDILKAEENKFSSAVDKHSTDSVEAKERAIQKMDADMQTKSEQIRKLTEEINALQQQKTTTMNDVTGAKAEIEKVRNNFAATMKIFTSRIAGDIDKIKSYLK
jgi:chromosome segregation ATPase